MCVCVHVVCVCACVCVCVCVCVCSQKRFVVGRLNFSYFVEEGDVQREAELVVQSNFLCQLRAELLGRRRRVCREGFDIPVHERNRQHERPLWLSCLRKMKKERDEGKKEREREREREWEERDREKEREREEREKIRQYKNSVVQYHLLWTVHLTSAPMEAKEQWRKKTNLSRMTYLKFNPARWL